MSFSFTDSQTLAIQSRGSSILVSAAAGSGKTRVLTERLLRYVSDADAPADIDRFLVITYTRAAAAELRARIMESLGALAAENPADLRLRRQQSLCCRAPIETIHSFCTAVLREYSHLLELSPAFSVLEEERAALLKRSIASRLLDQHYETIGDDAGFRLLADTVGAGRGDSRLEDTLLELYEKLRSHPYPEEWAAAQKAALAADGVTDVADTVWGREVLDGAAQSARYWAEAMDDAVREISASDEKLIRGYGESFSFSAAALRDFCRALGEGWDRAGEFAHIDFPRITSPRNYDDPEKLARLKATREQCKKACGKLESVFAQNSEALLRDLRAAAPAMCALLDLTLELDRLYTAEKKRRGVLDFSDLEHYAARLLVDKATGGPTWVATELSRRYTEIMVDEYQDVNAVQEMIFRAVSRGGNNLFMVGDVKQSIYRFRLADPGLFLEKYRSFAPAECAAPGAPRRILLQENFRSRRSILDAANHVFSNIMSVSLGELDYDDAAALRFGATGYDAAGEFPAELHIIGTGDADEESGAEAPEAAELEARFVAEKIRALMREGAEVTENGVTRPCTWGDFVLLLRSPNGKGRTFHRVLAEAGIPVESQQGSDFFHSLEVAVTIDLLTVIDNPHADIPLISVLRSPAFGFTADELSAIRACDKTGDYYSALCACAADGNLRAADFLRRLDDWRALAPEIGLDELVWRLCSETGLFAICAAMRDGEMRRRNLMHLFEYARTFGESGYRGVFRFVQWLRRLEEKGAEPETVSVGQAVRIMSIHKSKGLEFPFVFLCDLSHRFNLSDTRAPVPMHPVLGLGPKRIDTARGVEYPTIARRAVEQRLVTETLSEEMRVLYVGMTRAKERLFLSCVQSNPEKALENCKASLRRPLPPEILRGASSFASWIMLTALSAPELLTVTVHTAEESAQPDVSAAEAGAETAETGAVPESGADAAKLLRRQLDYVYPWPSAELLPSKLTATELKAGGCGEEEPDGASLLPDAEAELSFRLPMPGTAAAGLSAAQRGTATHTFLEHVSLEKTGTAAELKAEAARLCERGLLRRGEADAVDYAAVARLFASPLGARMRAAASLRREFRFLLLADAADYFSGTAADDRVLLQGVVDCCFEEDGGITVVDYKTDRVDAAQVPARAAAYRGQLRTYAKALQRIFGLPVKHCILWFLHSGTEYAVDLAED